jgi:hypothetical protein
MARKTVTLTIEEEGRDKGKIFVLTEMPATVGEKWAIQLLHLLVTQGGLQIDADAARGGMRALAGIGSGVALAMARALHDPSLEGWWDCVRYQHRPDIPLQPINQGITCQIEEIATITQLRMEVVKLHTDFFQGANPLTTGSPSPAPTPTGSLPTRTSRPQSVR